MARIVDATKIEVLREITISDTYPDAKITFRMGSDSVPTIAVSLVDDPRVTARNEIREWAANEIVKRDESDEDTALLNGLVEYLGERDAKTQITWGGDKGKQQPFAFTIYLTPEIGLSLANLLSGSEITYETGKAIRESLAGTSDTKGF